jgi:PAS domain S-box-containing protein
MNRSFQNLPINRKLTTVMMLTSSAALLLSCAGFVGYQLLSCIQNEKQNLATLGDVIAANSTAALSFHDQNSAEETLRGLKAEPSILSACLYTQDGTLFATYARDGSAQSCPATVSLGGSATFEYRRLTLSRSVVFDGRRIGTLCLQSDLAPEVLAYLKRAVSILLFVMAGSLLAALFVSRKLQHFISDPLRGLVTGTQELAGGNLSVRVAAVRSDEFGELAHAFNEMAGSLQQSHAEILDYQQTLEQRVKDRTIELEKEIAERKQAEQALAESNEVFRSAMHYSAIGMALVSPDGRWLEVNRVLCRIVGYTREELLATTFQAITHPDDLEADLDYVRQMLARTIENYQMEKRYVHKDGRIVWALLNVALIWRNDGSPRHFISQIEDITERKRVEEQLLVQTKAMEAAAFAIVITDSDGTISWVNRAFTKLTGYTREETVGQNPRVLKSGEHDPSFYRNMWGVISSGKVWAGELTNRRKDGTCYNEEMAITPVLGMGGKIAHYIAIKQDITERKRVAAELENMHKQLVDVSRQAGMAEVATNVLHNVGNVLNSVNVSTALVSDKIRESKVSSLAKVVALMRAHQDDLAAFLTQDPKGVQLCDYLDNLAQYLGKEQTGTLKELESLNANVEHIKEIVTMQQSYARASGIVDTLPIVDLVEDALRMNNGALARHEVQVIREYTATPSVPVDKHKVLQILVNLVRNAKYALDDGGRKDKLLTVRVATDSDGFVKILVIDNGVGIPRENLTRIFSHGFTTRKNGHGFGLHSGALAAKEMGGSLSAHSDGLGTGATFTLELPCAPGETN